MPTITINGKECSFEGHPSILEVADAHGVDIPRYCYHEGLSVVASCRICLAEVWAPNPRNDDKLEPIPRLLPACQTPAGDGQVVYTTSPKAIANQKSVMEYLLVNHPLDCPICDQAGECHLQDYSYRYGRGESRFEEEKIKQPKKDLGPTVWLYSDRCIMCTRCVRFTREVTETNELCVVGRGAKEQIDLFPGIALDNEMAGNVVDLCPVGALLDKDFLFAQRVWFLTSTPSIDGITASGDNIFVDHNEGRVYRIKPRRNLSVNKWWISDEIRYEWKFIHSEDRLDDATRVQHGDRVSTHFDSALEDIHDALGQATRAGEALALLVSPMLSCEEACVLGEYVLKMAGEQGSKVVIGVGPVPFDGEDRRYPPGAEATDRHAYTIRAEKAPNARGVRRVLEALAARAGIERVHDFEQWQAAVKNASAVVVTGNYPSPWATKELVKALNKKFVAVLDTFENDLTAKAQVVVPTSTWVEKAGTFENADGKLQAFEQAIAPLEGTRPEGRIAMELLALADDGPIERFHPSAVRERLSEEYGLSVFVDNVSLPTGMHDVESAMELVEL